LSEEYTMTDLMNAFFLVAAFGLAIAFVYGCEKLR
jgi:hypothetical protein